MSRKGKRAVTFYIPADLYALYAKACIDARITMTAGFVQYLEYLKLQQSSVRGGRLLYEGKKSDFGLES
jgi:hypothetical protein